MTFYKFWNDQGLVLTIFVTPGTKNDNCCEIDHFSLVFQSFVPESHKNTFL